MPQQQIAETVTKVSEVAARHPEITKGVTITVASFGVAELHAWTGWVLAVIGIAYTCRKWYLLEKNKKDPTRPPFKVD